jgi:hypothetical protein
MVNKVKGLLVLGAFVLAGAAYAQTPPATAKCSAAKMKCALNYVKGALTCQSNAAKKGDGSAATCISTKVEPKLNTAVTGCLPKADAKFPGGCSRLGATDADLVNDLHTIVGNYVTQNYPTSPALDLCAAGLLKCVSGLYTGLLTCDSKALVKGVHTSDGGAGPPPACTFKVFTKFDDALKGCTAKLVAKTTCPAGDYSTANRSMTNTSLDKSECDQMPAGTLTDTTQASAANCGTTDGTVNPMLGCGLLYLGGGDGTVPPGATPPGSINAYDLAGGFNRVCPRAASEDGGSNRHCTDVGCFFGSPLPVSNGTLSTCVNNIFSATTIGHTTAAGGFLGDVLLSSNVTVTGNGTQPCPHCVSGACDATSLNVGATCTTDATTGESHDCVPASVALCPGPMCPILPGFPVNLTGQTSGTSEKTDPGGIFCPAEGQGTGITGLKGAFGDSAVTDVKLVGSPITAGAATLVSVFCIPATGNILIDASSGLPGPGATALVLGVAIN